MGQKLHSGGRSVFRKRNPLSAILKWVIPAAALLAIGFFGAKYAAEHMKPVPPDGSAPAQETSVIAPEPLNESDPERETEDLPTAAPIADSVTRAFRLPFTALRGDGLASTLTAAADAGFNAAVFDMKDADGTLYYRSATSLAAQVGSARSNALTMQELRQITGQMRQAGIHPIVRIFAFRDHAGAKALPNARITPKGNRSWVWYDGKPDNGGRAWLNPYADEAHLYIIDLARELRDAGAAALLLDGVQFPFQSGSADYGSSPNTSMGRDAILTAFIGEMQQMLGEDFPVILRCDAEAALGRNTAVYGGNPLTFAPSDAAPVITPDPSDPLQTDLASTVRQIVTRLLVIEQAKRPRLIPWLEVSDCTAVSIRGAMTACSDNGANSFILCREDGRYDFSALAE